jgi:sugar diacid utilization regulator
MTQSTARTWCTPCRCSCTTTAVHKRSARVLHLHTNTVAYRAVRIRAITGLDLGDPDDRLVAHIAVKIIESQGSAAM